MDQLREELLELLRARAYRAGKFVLASGKESDFFIDVKQVSLLARGHVLLGQQLFQAIHHELYAGARLVAGVALGGCPLASAVSMYGALQESYALDVVYVRKEAKDHGTRKLVESPVPMLDSMGIPICLPIVLLEDVITTGGSSLAAIRNLRDVGLAVTLVAAVVDREEGGREALEEAGVKVVSLFRRSDFVKAEA